MYRASVLTLLAAAATLALTGCTSAGGASSAPASASSVASPAKPSFTPSEGAAKELQGTSCSADASGAWTFAGKITNKSDKPSEYTIRLSIIKKQGSTVVAVKEVVQKVEPGKTVDVKAEKFATPKEKADELQCVPSTTVKRG